MGLWAGGDCTQPQMGASSARELLRLSSETSTVVSSPPGYVLSPPQTLSTSHPPCGCCREPSRTREDADPRYFGPFLALSRCIPGLSLHHKEGGKKVTVAQVSGPFLGFTWFGVAMATPRFPAGGCEGRASHGRGEKVATCGKYQPRVSRGGQDSQTVFARKRRR